MKRIFYEICKDKQDTLAIIDFNGDIITANKKFHEITFIADRSVKKLNIFQLVDKSYHKQIRERLGQLEKGNPTQPMEYKLIDKAGGSTYVEMSSQPVTYHNKKAIVTRIRNISHHKEMEKKLYEAIIQTEEKEKQRFAQDLHDELGPFLSGIKLYIDEIELSDKNRNHRKKLIEYLRKTVDEAIAKTRIISNSLMSNILMDFGLNKALNSFVDKMNNIHQVKIKLDIDNVNGGLCKTLEIIIYRIIIELINNSLKHANPNNIYIALHKKDTFVTMLYKDDGKGFNIEREFKSPSGIGLNSIINRLKSKHASYNYSSKMKEGMQFECKLPLN